LRRPVSHCYDLRSHNTHTTRPMKPHAIQPTSASGVAIGLGCADGGFGLVVVDAGNPLRQSTFATP